MCKGRAIYFEVFINKGSLCDNIESFDDELLVRKMHFLELILILIIIII